jgi:hypothetical protein
VQGDRVRLVLACGVVEKCWLTTRMKTAVT